MSKQIKIFEMSKSSELYKMCKEQELLIELLEAKLFASRIVWQENKGKQSAGMVLFKERKATQNENNWGA